MPHALADDIERVSRIAAVPAILEIICHTTGMRFAAVARVTEDRWIACQVRDELTFGLRPGDQLKIETTICNEIRQSGTAVLIDDVASDAAYWNHDTLKIYGLQSYASMPINLPDGSFFGTLCAIDREPRRVNTPQIIAMFEIFANLIGIYLGTFDKLTSVQSLNVRLQMVNAELKRKNDLLASMANDFRNLLDSTNIPTLFLDKQKRVRNFTPNISELFTLRNADIGRPVGDVPMLLDYPSLDADIVYVMATLEVVEREISSLSETSLVFLMRMRPYRRGDDSIDGVVLTFTDITERKQQDIKLWFQTHHDVMTGLPNRTMFHAELKKGKERPDTDATAALLLIDLDHFNEINDSYGHVVGDRMLQLVAARLRRCANGSDLICRIGGDDFAILQSNAIGPAASIALADRILVELSLPTVIEGHTIHLSASIGIAMLADAGDGGETLVHAADTALYEAKSRTGSNWRIFSPGTQNDAQIRRDLEHDLRDALSRDELFLMYQPLVQLADGQITGAEALLRWQHPERGLLPPSVFIPMAEASGLIVPIGNWVLQTACMAAASWAKKVPVAVNLSAVQFGSHDLVQQVRHALKASNLPPSRLALEVTETVLLQDNLETQSIIASLRGIGVTIVMDDFGTGYSSLSYLREFMIDKIKIDKRFGQTVDSQPKSGVIVKAIIAMSRELGIAICAEGAETQAQLTALEQLGVTEVQGFALYKPMLNDYFAALAAAQVPAKEKTNPMPRRL